MPVASPHDTSLLSFMWGFLCVTIQFQVTTTMNSLMLTHCMNASYMVGHKQASSLLFQCVVYIVRALIKYGVDM
jgi:hypothetical protein